MRNMTGVKVDTFENIWINEWLKIPDQPICKGYEMYARTKGNAIYDQNMVSWQTTNKLANCQEYTLSANT